MLQGGFDTREPMWNDVELGIGGFAGLGVCSEDDFDGAAGRREGR